MGGDLFKAVFVAREQPGYRTEAIATIVVDRVCGMYALLLVASAALWLSGFASINGTMASIAYSTYLLTLIGTIGLLFVMTPALVHTSVARRFSELPRIGPLFERLFVSVRQYQNSKPELIVIGLLSVAVHGLLAVGIYLVSRAFFIGIPSLAEHFVISPLACVAASIPITPGGLGTYELAMTELYALTNPTDGPGRGVVVALFFRFATILAAGVGVVFYWLRHREVMQVLREAEEQAGSVA